MRSIMTQHVEEVQAGQRFEFGRNWRKFLDELSEERISRAEYSLQEMLGMKSLIGFRVLDIGSGSGLFSLAARRLGASVQSFDYDPQSVACTAELKRRYFEHDQHWRIDEGSILDEGYVRTLGTFNVVYSWGVLHHTGRMWQALEHAASLVAENGQLFIAIYNDQGGASCRWLLVKRLYNWLPRWAKFAVLWPSCVRLWGPTIFRDLLSGNPFRTWVSYKQQRGMSPWRDIVDWVGGYPFEVAKPEGMFDFFSAKGFVLKKLKTCGGGHGCNEFVFERARRS